MLFSNFVVKDAIIPDLKATCVREAIDAMLASLCEAGAFEADDYDSVLEVVLKREKLGSTAIGKSRMIPHAKSPMVKQSVGCVAICRDGIKSSSVDKSAIKILFLLLSPPDRPGDHLRCLENISRRSADSAFRSQILGSQSTEEIWDVLLESDEGRLVFAPSFNELISSR